jgi:hypothetical protein
VENLLQYPAQDEDFETLLVERSPMHQGVVLGVAAALSPRLRDIIEAFLIRVPSQPAQKYLDIHNSLARRDEW